MDVHIFENFPYSQRVEINNHEWAKTFIDNQRHLKRIRYWITAYARLFIFVLL